MFRRLPLSLLIAGAVLTALATSVQAAPAGSYRVALKTTFHVAVPPDADKNGIGKCHQGNFNGEGPNGLVLAYGAIYAGNGNSHVLGYSLRTGRLIANYKTGGKLQADELTVAGRYLVVTNPAEIPRPFISFIDLRAKRVVARYTFTRATGGLGGRGG
jgi:outer membrane protein assembly factor BamB